MLCRAGEGEDVDGFGLKMLMAIYILLPIPWLQRGLRDREQVGDGVKLVVNSNTIML